MNNMRGLCDVVVVVGYYDRRWNCAAMKGRVRRRPPKILLCG